jgi:hypothetical protein
LKKTAAARVPAASDERESLADWLELQALFSREQRVSRESLVQVLHRNGSTDAMGEDDAAEDIIDRGSVKSQERGDDAFAEIDDRSVACRGRYPFKVDQGCLILEVEPWQSDYLFLLLLSEAVPTSGYDGTAALFEDLCVEATLGYLGGSTNNAQAYRFGSPRRPPISQLHNALNNLCLRLGEGGRCRYPELATHKGDDQLDIVGWRDFPDRREGKLAILGQCCAGRTMDVTKWRALGETGSFVNKWLTDPPCVRPQRAFYVPRRLRRHEWKPRSEDAGLVFDRCRIVGCAGEPQAPLAERRKKAIQKLMAAKVSGSA